jgi:hypothetical protein
VQGSIVMVIMALGWWRMWNLGSDSLASHSDSLTAHPDPIYVAGCAVSDPLEKSSTRGGVGKVEAVLRKVPLTRLPRVGGWTWRTPARSRKAKGR